MYCFLVLTEEALSLIPYFDERIICSACNKNIKKENQIICGKCNEDRDSRN